jgi:quercetin dioxygenase-like cupin family protein
MKIVRFTDDGRGGSRFVEREAPFAETYVDKLGGRHPRSREFTSAGRIVEFASALSMDWHPAPGRRVIVVLAGTIEVETTDGEVRRFGTGEVVIADDTKGKGHRTRVAGGPARLLFLDVTPEVPADVFAT